MLWCVGCDKHYFPSNVSTWEDDPRGHYCEACVKKLHIIPEHAMQAFERVVERILNSEETK